MSTNPEMSEVDLTRLDLMDSRLVREGFPHAVFARLRKEAPVWWQPIRAADRRCIDPGFWVLSKYDDVQEVSRDAELFCSIDGPTIGHVPGMEGTMLVTMDGEQHTRQRKIISSGFTPRMVGRLEDQARRWAGKIVDDALARGRVEFVQEVAYQLPMHMIADIVGIPLADRKSLFDLATRVLNPGDPDDPETPARHAASQVEMFDYAQKLVQKKREDPQDDVWTVISNAEVETEDGRTARLSETELNFFFFLLTLAGSETTRNAISHGLIALLDHPDQLETLRRDPDAMRPAVEEILRWSSPVAYFARRATRDTEIRGVKISEGDRVTLWYPSANRDEEVFEDPFRFDIGRAPNHHVAFGGGGAHFCLGANLARREIAILFEELLARAKEIEILERPKFGVLGILNPILVIPSEIQVRIA
ncbi:MAG: cytochrome P450 [Deltaproteobacteria bacterium]|nr:cytochrome P450 [Deltaproteobacteria bacterium]